LTTADQIGTWRVPQSQFAIEYSIAALNKINRAAGDALVALRGGLGIGGVLLGSRDAKGIKILEFRAVECEYAFGPVFALSDHDRRKLAQLLRDIRQDPGVKGLEVVGWYVSHTRRGGRMLAESDLDIYRTFFPESRQVTLVLHPTFMAPTVAGFFFREPDGSIRSSSTYLEFSLGTWQGGESPEPATPNAPPDQPSSRLEAVRTEPLVPQTRVAEGAMGLRPISRPAAADQPEEPPAEFPAMERAIGSMLPPPTGLQPSSESREAARSSTQRKDLARTSNAFLLPIWLWLAGVLVVAAAAGLTVKHWLPSHGLGPAALHLKAMERNGLLEIRWDNATLALQKVQGGVIAITDGTVTESFSLDAPQVMTGSVLYPRRSDNVEVHMTVKLTAGTMTEGYITFAADPKGAVAAKNDQQAQKELITEAERTQEDLNRAQERKQQLEKALKMALEAQPGANLAVPSNRQGPGRGGSPAATAETNAQTARLSPAYGNAGPAGSRPQPTRVATPPERISSPLPGAGRSAGPEPERPAPSAGLAAPAAAPTQVPRSQVPAPITAQEAAQPVWPSARERLTSDDVLKVAQPHERSAPNPKPPPVPRPLPQAPPSLTGNWDYSAAFPSASPFPPKSATLTLVQGNDQVTGTFMGQYRVPKGRKFKADVQLRFAGPARPGPQKFTFNAADGNTGEIEILPVAGKPNEIEVVWHSARDGLTFDDVLFRAK
jgi:hypothetical protein